LKFGGLPGNPGRPFDFADSIKWTIAVCGEPLISEELVPPRQEVGEGSTLPALITLTGIPHAANCLAVHWDPTIGTKNLRQFYKSHISALRTAVNTVLGNELRTTAYEQLFSTASTGSPCEI
jgi:hypothetical protein